MDNVSFHGRAFWIQSATNVDQDSETLEFCDPPDDPITHGDLIISATQYGDFGSSDVTVNTHEYEVQLEVLAEVIDYARRRHGMLPRPPRKP